MSVRDRSRDEEMDEEMRLHVALLTERNLRAGMSPREARRAALLAFGPTEAIRETARAGRRLAWLRDLGRDAAYSGRMLLRERGVSAVMVLTLGLGIGACAAIFSVVESVLLRPLPYPESHRLMVLTQTNPPRFPELVVLPGAYVEWRKQSRSFEDLAAVRTRSFSLTGIADPLSIRAARITANTLSLLRVRPALGRDFAAEEEVAGKGSVAILGHGFWRRHLGGRSDVLGQVIRLDGQPFTVIGVLPSDFDLGGPLDLVVPAAYTDGDPQNRLSLGAHALEVFGRLRPGVTPAGAQSELSLIARRLEEQAPASKKGWGVKLRPMLESKVGDVRPLLLSLLGAVAFLLLIACANAANLLLVRGAARAREIAVRAALGATRGRIVRQLLTESVLLALGGGLLGLLVARCGVAALVTFAPDGLPRAAEIGVHPWAFAFTSALALCTGVAFGLAPALVAARVPLHETLKAGAGAGGGRPGGVGGRARLPSALVVAEVTIALILLAGAGLLIRSFVLLQKVDRGFRPEGAVSFSLSLPPHHYGSDARLAAFAAEATARLAALPGVEAVGASQALPFSVQLNIVYFEIVGRPPVTDWPTTHVFEVTPGYFRAMGIPLVRGRLFDARDSADAPRVAIINESLARRFFPGEDPIGKRVRDPTRPSTAFADIVGVVADVKDGLVYKLDGGGAAMQSYVPFAQNTYDVLTFVLRTRGPSAGLAGAVRAAIRELDPDHPVAGLRPLDELVAASVARQRFAMFLFAVFSAVALVLAAVGIYGVMAYTVARRTGEIGIRIALGAEARDVVRLVLLQGARLVAFGIGLGLGGALLLTRLLGALLFGVAPHDPLTFGATAALLSGVAALACLLPARRATRIDPMTALRAE